jgi:hypothetical protein
MSIISFTSLNSVFLIHHEFERGIRYILVFIYYCIPSDGFLYIFPFIYMYIFQPLVINTSDIHNNKFYYVSQAPLVTSVRWLKNVRRPFSNAFNVFLEK